MLRGLRSGVTPLQPGISTGHDPYNRNLTVNTTNFDAMTNTIRATRVRLTCEWSTVEATQGSYDWTIPDMLFDLADARGMEVLFVLLGSPAWARTAGEPSNSYPPTSVTGAWPAFCTAAVNRYKARGSGCKWWEVWNEPNGPFGFGSNAYPASKYVGLIGAAYTAIKADDPTANVVVGGIDLGASLNLVPNWLAAEYAAGLQGKFDVMAVHPYAKGEDPANTGSSTNGWNKISGTRDVMIANGDADKVIFVTEVGQPTGSSTLAVSQATQASYLASMLSRIREFPYVQRFYWHQDIDSGSNAAVEAQNYGLLTSAGAQKTACGVFAGAR